MDEYIYIYICQLATWSECLLFYEVAHTFQFSGYLLIADSQERRNQEETMAKNKTNKRHGTAGHRRHRLEVAKVHSGDGGYWAKRKQKNKIEVIDISSDDDSKQSGGVGAGVGSYDFLSDDRQSIRKNRMVKVREATHKKGIISGKTTESAHNLSEEFKLDLKKVSHSSLFWPSRVLLVTALIFLFVLRQMCAFLELAPPDNTEFNEVFMLPTYFHDYGRKTAVLDSREEIKICSNYICGDCGKKNEFTIAMNHY